MPIFSFQSFSMHFLIFAINFAAESRRSSLFPLDVYSNSEFDFSLQTSASKAYAFDLRLSGSMQIERNRVTYFYVIPISNIAHTKAGPWLSCTSQVLLNT